MKHFSSVALGLFAISSISEAASYRPYPVIQNNGRNIAVRSGDWKWIPAQKNQNQELYDLKNDPSELHDLQYPYYRIINDLNESVFELSQVKK